MVKHRGWRAKSISHFLTRGITVAHSSWLRSNDLALAGTFVGDIATEFSDVVLEQTFQMKEVMNLSVGNETCQAWAVVGRCFQCLRVLSQSFPCLSMSQQSFLTSCCSLVNSCSAWTCPGQVSASDDRSWLGVRGRAPWTSPVTSCLTRAFEASFFPCSDVHHGSGTWGSVDLVGLPFHLNWT